MQALICAWLGALLAVWLSDAVFGEHAPWTAALFGACLGWVAVALRRLHVRVQALEHATPGGATPSASTRQDTPQVPPQVTRAVSAAAPAPSKAQPGLLEAGAPRVPVTAAVVVPRTPSRTGISDPYAAFVARAKRWLGDGNLPVKLGVLVCFLGVGSLLKYAVDAGWLRVSMPLRLACMAMIALAALAFAWRQRHTRRAFALALQGGALGVLIVLLFAAYRLFGLLSPFAAFGLLVAVVALAGALAVLQDALALAVLALVGGFLAPILASRGSGNAIALFGYYAVLNATIFALAWARPWRVLNLLGFAFTFGIGTAWGVLAYRPEQFGAIERFLVLFFFFYLFLPLLQGLRAAPDRRDLIDATLVFGTPLLAWPLQAALLDFRALPLALCAVLLAAIYAVLAALELRRWRLPLLGQAHALLALGFATLAIPLASSARATACLWALEGAAVLWVGLRQQRRVARWIGYALQGGAGLALLFALQPDPDTAPQYMRVIFNGDFLGALLVALAGLASARLLRLRGPSPLALGLFLWGWAWWLQAGGHEIERFASAATDVDWTLALFCVGGLFGALAARYLRWPTAAWPALAALLLAPAFVIATAIDNHGALEGGGAWAWVLWLGCALRMLVDLRAMRHAWRHAMHAASWWSIALVLGAEAAHLADAHGGLNALWSALAGLAPLTALFAAVLLRAPALRWPDPAGAERMRNALLASLAAVLGAAWCVGLFAEGTPTPLRYVPLANPLELAQLGLLALLFAWNRRAAREGSAMLGAEARARALALAGFAWLTSAALRATHFLGTVPWDGTLWQSPLAQAALSVAWTCAGIAAMLLGKQRGSRAVWIGGAALMGVVIAKLLLVDRTHLHDLAAIVGVLFVGLLLVAVGYFAPAPPRQAPARA